MTLDTMYFELWDFTILSDLFYGQTMSSNKFSYTWTPTVTDVGTHQMTVVSDALVDGYLITRNENVYITVSIV